MSKLNNVIHVSREARQGVALSVELGDRRCPFTEWTPAQGRLFDKLFAVDTETTKIDETNPQVVPAMVVAAACDGVRGVFIGRDKLPAFFQAHSGSAMICHNAPFDLKVMQLVLGQGLDLYQWVEQGRVWDTQILRRLLSLATEGHTARGQSSLAGCVRDLLGLELPKDGHDDDGCNVRTGFGRYLGQPPSEMPRESLEYAARDPLATWLLFQELYLRIKAVLQGSSNVWGYVDHVWLKACIDRYGPLTHRVQLRAAILVDVLHMNGIGIDLRRREEKAKQVESLEADCRERLRRQGYLVGEPGTRKALQSILASIQRKHPEIELMRTETGMFSTAEEDLLELARSDTFFKDLVTQRSARKLASTYLCKMGKNRLHPKFGYLLATGRTYCGGGFNLQNLPRELDMADATATIRGCFVPPENHVFVDVDYNQIELVVLAYALERQFGQASRLAELINNGQDIHRVLASILLRKPVGEITKYDRQSVKPVSFGRPGGMGAKTLQGIARSSYDVELTMGEVEERIAAYHRLCPELDFFLADELNTGHVLAQAIGLKLAAYFEVRGSSFKISGQNEIESQRWLGGMLLKTLREERPRTGKGREYTKEELDFFWQAAERLSIKLEPGLRSKLTARQAHPRLWAAVRDWAGRRSVFTLTGRLRAAATFCSARNCIFQGPSADGAILGMWRVWRAGYRIVDFVHDQVVVEVAEDDQLEFRKNEVAQLMRQGMLEVVPGMNVQVETVITRSLNKAEVVEETAADPDNCPVCESTVSQNARPRPDAALQGSGGPVAR